MHLEEFERYNVSIADLLGHLASRDFGARLAAIFAAGVAFDDCMVVCFRPSAPPEIVHSTPNDAAGREYAAGPYLLDPYYEAFRKSRHGCFRFRDLAPDRTRLSEDFLAHYRRYDIGDEIGLILAMDQGRGGHVSLTRRRGRPMFARADCQWLSATAPLVETAMRQRDAGISNEPKARDIRLHDGLNRALNNFGRSVLTEREVDVVRWLLRGYPAKAIARQLAISPETVRNHLKNIYPKLKIGSHAELFALFFRAIQAGSGSHDSDPLADLP